MFSIISLFFLPLLSLTLIHAAPLVSRVDAVEFTGYWPEKFVEIAGYNKGWIDGSGNYTYTGILTYPNQNTTNETIIFENQAIKSYIYHFGDIDAYPFNSSFQFRIEDAADSTLFDESPVLPIISKEQAFGTPSASADAPAETA
ncbi:hypothetical protein I302_101426 [Kwoniella bestiolae CBS 10118]|uniref:Uncharacterized protein n=1 Tax=Kwoniella bestiolae CBS 10118 TaxID=1296100 RepID=A0A1B9GCA6_9TREE|nr:hypothetical protein I302_00109 [Kwoniella bestiolae CBS 10118]OCF28621.1 hypothetical protein I302_00109 [Kwoniella bestiolae CBS 10118]